MANPTTTEIQKARKTLITSGIIDCFWHIDDIISRGLELQNSRTITKKQAREIAKLIERRHDANVGINWETIDIWIEEYFENK